MLFVLILDAVILSVLTMCSVAAMFLCLFMSSPWALCSTEFAQYTEHQGHCKLWEMCANKAPAGAAVAAVQSVAATVSATWTNLLFYFIYIVMLCEKNLYACCQSTNY